MQRLRRSRKHCLIWPGYFILFFFPPQATPHYLTWEERHLQGGDWGSQRQARTCSREQTPPASRPAGGSSLNSGWTADKLAERSDAKLTASRKQLGPSAVWVTARRGSQRCVRAHIRVCQREEERVFTQSQCVKSGWGTLYCKPLIEMMQVLRCSITQHRSLSYLQNERC